MALQPITGCAVPILVPGYPYTLNTAALSSGVTLDAAGELLDMIGHVYLPNLGSATKTISSAGGSIFMRTGTVTFANGTTNLRIGIQDVATAVGSFPPRGDGTFDVQADYVPGVETISSSTWTEFVMESGTKTLTHGQLIAVSAEMTARGGADSVILGVSLAGLTSPVNRPFIHTFLGAAHGTQNHVPNCLIKFDDGTFGTLQGAFPMSALTNTANFDSGDTPDEVALIFQVPFKCKIIGMVMSLAVAATTDFEAILYSDPEGTPAAVSGGTVTVEGDQIASSGNQYPTYLQFAAEIALTINTKYAIALRPTTTNTGMSFSRFSMGSAAQMDVHNLGQNAYYGTRTNQTGAFSTTTTDRPLFSIVVSSLDDGVSSGSGGNPFHKLVVA